MQLSGARVLDRLAEIRYNTDRRRLFSSVFAPVMHVDTMDPLPSVIRPLPVSAWIFPLWMKADRIVWCFWGPLKNSDNMKARFRFVDE